MNAQPDFSGRLARLRSEMERCGATVFVCDHGEMLAWLTGYTVSETLYRGCLVPIEGDPVWILRAIDEASCRSRTWVQDVRTFADTDDPFDLFGSVVSDMVPADGLLAADFRSYGFTAYVRDRFQAVVGERPILDLSGISDRIRAVKDASELASLSKAARIADGAMVRLVEMLAPGMAVREAAALASDYYLRNGADDWWVGPMAISRSSDPKQAGQDADLGFLHPPGLDDQILAAGDIFHAELVPRVDLYSARLMRCISLGDPTNEMHELYAALVAVQDAQLAAMVSGATAEDVDAVARQRLVPELRQPMPNVTGYQIGIYAKTPRSSDFSFCFRPGADWKLADGMTFHMYLSASGLSISESVVIEEGRARRLCQMPRTLLVAGSLDALA